MKKKILYIYIMFKYILFLIFGIILFLYNNIEGFTIGCVGWAHRYLPSEDCPRDSSSGDPSMCFNFYYNPGLTEEEVRDRFPNASLVFYEDFPRGVVHGPYPWDTNLDRIVETNIDAAMGEQTFNPYDMPMAGGAMPAAVDPSFRGGGGSFDFSDGPPGGGMSAGGTGLGAFCNDGLACSAVTILKRTLQGFTLGDVNDNTILSDLLGDDMVSPTDDPSTDDPSTEETPSADDIINQTPIQGFNQNASFTISRATGQYITGDGQMIDLISSSINAPNSIFIYCTTLKLRFTGEDPVVLDIIRDIQNIGQAGSGQGNSRMFFIEVSADMQRYSNSYYIFEFPDRDIATKTINFLLTMRGDLATKDNLKAQKLNFTMLIDETSEDGDQYILYDVDTGDADEDNISEAMRLLVASGEDAAHEFDYYSDLTGGGECNTLIMLTKKITTDGRQQEIIVARAFLKYGGEYAALHDFSAITRGCGYGTRLMYLLAKLRVSVSVHNTDSKYKNQISWFLPEDGAKKAYQHQFYLSVTQWPRIPGEYFSIYNMETVQMLSIYSSFDLSDLDYDGIDISEFFYSMRGKCLSEVFQCELQEGWFTDHNRKKVEDRLMHFIMKNFHELEKLARESAAELSYPDTEEFDDKIKSFEKLLFQLDFDDCEKPPTDDMYETLWLNLFRTYVVPDGDTEDLLVLFRDIINNYLYLTL